MSSISPLAGRLSQIFSPRSCIFVAAICFALGALVTSQAHSIAIFLVGRAISGIGGAGIMTLSLILVLELSSKKRRGLFVGLVNTGYTIGVALGAVVAGAVFPVFGWVNSRESCLSSITNDAVAFTILVPDTTCFAGWRWSIFQPPLDICL